MIRAQLSNDEVTKKSQNIAEISQKNHEEWRTVLLLVRRYLVSSRGISLT